MNLYVISQSEERDWDTYDSAVVAAENEDSARRIHPGGYSEDDWSSRSWAHSPENVTVRLIGVAEPGVEPGVVVASFNAG